MRKDSQSTFLTSKGSFSSNKFRIKSSVKLSWKLFKGKVSFLQLFLKKNGNKWKKNFFNKKWRCFNRIIFLICIYSKNTLYYSKIICKPFVNSFFFFLFFNSSNIVDIEKKSNRIEKWNSSQRFSINTN